MSNEELVKLIQEGHTEYLSQLWDQVEKFIRMRADQKTRSETNNGCSSDDLYQSGYFALLRAVNGYKPEYGKNFIGYLDLWLKNIFYSVMEIQTVKQKMEPLNNSISIETPIEKSRGVEFLTIMDTLPDLQAEDDFEIVTDLDMLTEIFEIINQKFHFLTTKEKIFLNTLIENNLIVRRASKQMGVSHQNGSELYHKVIQKIRNHIKAKMKGIEEVNAILDRAYKHNGLEVWKNNLFTSQTEILALKLVEKEEYNKEMIN